MRRLSALLASVMLLPVCLAGEAKSSIEWQNPSDRVWKAARESGKPMLIEVWGNWCAPCKRMDREVWSDARVIEATKKFICVSVDVSSRGYTSEAQLALGLKRGFGVRVVPTVILLDPWREVLIMNEGFAYVKELVALLNGIPPDYTEIRERREALETNRNNSRALAALAAFYHKNKAFGLANRYYRDALEQDGVKEDRGLREDILFEIAANHLLMMDWKEGRTALEQFRREFPESSRMDGILFGLVLAETRQGKRADAGKHLDELTKRFPQSRYVATAQKVASAAK